MGYILIAHCENCRFEKEIFFGSGMDNFFSVLNVPAVNSETGEFVVENILEKENLDESLIFYNDKSMFKGKISEYTINWGGLKLNRKNNLCPNCITFSLTFEDVGIFD
jgi:hypothetical protein